MPDPIVRARGRGCVVQLVSLVVAVGVVGVFLVVAMGAGSLAPGDGVSQLAVFGACFLALIVAFAVGAVMFAAGRSRVLDPGFAQLGIAGAGSLPNLREYHGTWSGRAVDALYVRRGPLLETSVDARIHGALAVGTRTGVGDLVRGALGLPTITLHDPAFAHLTVAAADGAWAAAVLATPAVRDGVLRAMHDPTGREHRVVAIRPGAVRMTRRFFDPARAVGEVAPMVALLSSIGAAVEALPPPSSPVALTDFERMARKAPGAMGARVVVWLLVGVLLVVAVVSIAVMVAAPSLARPVGGSDPTTVPWGGRHHRR